MSFVRSNAEGTVGHLLRDWRRLNVALSRAKHKLLLIGSLRTLSSCAVMSSLGSILKSRGWVYSLPPGAHRLYPQGLANPEKESGNEEVMSPGLFVEEKRGKKGNIVGVQQRPTLQCNSRGSSDEVGNGTTHTTHRAVELTHGFVGVSAKLGQQVSSSSLVGSSGGSGGVPVPSRRSAD